MYFIKSFSIKCFKMPHDIFYYPNNYNSKIILFMKNEKDLK